MKKAIYLIIIALMLSASVSGKNSKNSLKKCDKFDLFKEIINSYCSVNIPKNFNNVNKKSIYILYDVNPGEGFNLRRDVYIRLAVFLRNLHRFDEYKNTKIVLPPFPHLYHWKSRDIAQNRLFWNHFFDLKSLKLYANVLDFWEFFNELNKFNKIIKNGKIQIDNVYKMKYFENMFEDGKFIEKYAIENCPDDSEYQLDEFFGYKNVTAKQYSCLEFQGSAGMLKEFLDKHVMINTKNVNIILLRHAETVLHDHWGNDAYWEARRSMRFNNYLVEIANAFRLRTFNSTDQFDLVQRPKSWLKEKPYRKAVGGNYVCAHLRRADFLHGREKTTPTIMSAAKQIKDILNKLNLHKVFISSDCSKTEFKDLKNYLIRYKVVRYTTETKEEKNRIKDGGIAIIDQIICSHAKYFIGTYESTFTYRIYEEREILGFRKDKTFNTFCKIENMKDCEKNSVWPIVY